MEIRTAFRVMVSVGFVVLFLAAPLANVYAQSAKEPIKIGINTEFTGVLSETSTNTKQGYDLYLQEIGTRSRDDRSRLLNMTTNPIPRFL